MCEDEREEFEIVSADGSKVLGTVEACCCQCAEEEWAYLEFGPCAEVLGVMCDMTRPTTTDGKLSIPASQVFIIDGNTRVWLGEPFHVHKTSRIIESGY